MKKRRRSSLPFSNSARAKANAKTLTFHNKVIAPHKQCNKLKWDNTFWTKLAVDTMAAHEKKKQSKEKTKPSSSSISLSPCSSISSYDSEEIFHRREKARARRAKAIREQQQQERKKNKKRKMKKKPIVMDVSSDSDEDEVDIHTLIVIKNAAKKKKRKVTFVDVYRYCPQNNRLWFFVPDCTTLTNLSRSACCRTTSGSRVPTTKCMQL